MKASGFLNPIRRINGLTQKIGGNPHETEIRVYVKDGFMRVVIVGRPVGDTDEMKSLFEGGVGGEVVALHRVLQVLRILPELDHEALAHSILACLRYSPSLDTPAGFDRKTLRARQIGSLERRFTETVIDGILRSFPEDLIGEFRFFQQAGVELNGAAITDAVEDGIMKWDPAFAEFGIETPQERRERRRANAEREQQTHQLEPVGEPA